MSNKFFSNSYDSDSSESDEENQTKTKANTKNKNINNDDNKSLEIGSESDDSENTNKDNTKEVINNMTNLVTLRYIKDGKAARTYIEGLQFFFTTVEVKTIAKDIQKKLSTGYFSNGESHGFNGDHRIKLEKMLHTQYNIPKNKIKVC